MKANQVGPAMSLPTEITSNSCIDIEKLLEELQKQNAEQRELLNNLSESELSLPFYVEIHF